MDLGVLWNLRFVKSIVLIEIYRYTSIKKTSMTKAEFWNPLPYIKSHGVAEIAWCFLSAGCVWISFLILSLLCTEAVTERWSFWLKTWPKEDNVATFPPGALDSGGRSQSGCGYPGELIDFWKGVKFGMKSVREPWTERLWDFCRASEQGLSAVWGTEEEK